MTRSDLQELLYHNEKDNKIVVYTSSLESIRHTRDGCRAMLTVFDLLQLKVGPFLVKLLVYHLWRDHHVARSA